MAFPIGNSVWTDERVAQLRDLWAVGDSAAVIGRKMEITRNAVLGKAHRLKLETRWVKSHTRPAGPVVVRVPKKTPRQSVMKSRERKPRFRTVNPDSAPPLLPTISVITGALMTVRRPRATHGPELTKNELRAQLTQAVINTGGVAA